VPQSNPAGIAMVPQKGNRAAGRGRCVGSFTARTSLDARRVNASE
jgi:hypothetical protein